MSAHSSRFCHSDYEANPPQLVVSRSDSLLHGDHPVMAAAALLALFAFVVT